MVELKLVWWPQFPTEEFEYHYLPLTATVGTPRFEYEEAPYFQRLLLHANAAQVTRKKAVISCLAAAMVHGIPVLNLERSTRVELNLPGKARPPSGYPEIFHYRNAYLPESDITVVRGYRVTTVERTFVDICAVNGELEGLVFLESALRRGYTRIDFNTTWTIIMEGGVYLKPKRFWPRRYMVLTPCTRLLRAVSSRNTFHTSRSSPRRCFPRQTRIIV